jgi:hypothetical protein
MVVSEVMAKKILAEVEKLGDACINVGESKWVFTPESRVKILKTIEDSLDVIIDVLREEMPDCDSCERIHPDDIGEYVSSFREDIY